MKDKKEYFLIWFGEDGISIDRKTRKQIEELLEEGTEWETKIEDSYCMGGGNYPLHKCLIIKGEPVIPEVVEIVKKYKI